MEHAKNPRANLEKLASLGRNVRSHHLAHPKKSPTILRWFQRTTTPSAAAAAAAAVAAAAATIATSGTAATATPSTAANK